MPPVSLVSIDPGLAGTGVAYWKRATTNILVPPTSVAVLTTRTKGIEWDVRARSLADDVVSVVDAAEHKVIVVSEFTEFYDAPSKSMSWKTGDLQKLTFFIGLIAGRLDDIGIHMELATPRMWKGQLPKHVIERRIRKRLGEKACTALGIKTHAWDAVGIGMWKQGHL